MANKNENFWTAPWRAITDATQTAANATDFGMRLQKIRNEIELEEKSVVDASDMVGCTWCGRIIDKKDIRWTTSDNGVQYIHSCPYCQYDDCVSDAGGRMPFTADELYAFSDAGQSELARDEEWLIKNGLGGYIPDTDTSRIPMNITDIAGFMEWLQYDTENLERLGQNEYDMADSFYTGTCNDGTDVLLIKFIKSIPADDDLLNYYFVPVPPEMLAEYMATRDSSNE